jgi:hypothetical protein
VAGAQAGLMSLSSVIAKIGVNPFFIAFNAHAWFAFSIVSTFYSKWMVAAALLATFIKEFWFDATYEVPKQTFEDNLTDWLGYCSGIGLAVLTKTFL